MRLHINNAGIDATANPVSKVEAGEYWTFCYQDGAPVYFTSRPDAFEGLFVFSTREALKEQARAILWAGWNFDGVGLCSAEEINGWIAAGKCIYLNPILSPAVTIEQVDITGEHDMGAN